MIFAGDIALPYPKAIQLEEAPQDLFEKLMIANLEGSLIFTNSKNQSERKVYNSLHAIQEFCSIFNLGGVVLANNHIKDAAKIEVTIDHLLKIGVPFTGAGKSITDATTPLVLWEGKNQIVILNFGWSVIQCPILNDSEMSFGVAPLNRVVVETAYNSIRKKYKKAKIVCFMHWGYELEAEPQPYEREFAHHLIDLGVDLIVGTHSHRVGGIEIYKGKPIAYGLGNFMFRQEFYYANSLKFPRFCREEILFEVTNWDSMTFQLHLLEQDADNTTLWYRRTISSDDPYIQHKTPFAGLSPLEYQKWYRKNHYHQNKGLPIYYWTDSNMVIKIKNRINKIRDKFLVYLFNKGKLNS